MTSSSQYSPVQLALNSVLHDKMKLHTLAKTVKRLKTALARKINCDLRRVKKENNTHCSDSIKNVQKKLCELSNSCRRSTGKWYFSKLKELSLVLYFGSPRGYKRARQILTFYITVLEGKCLTTYIYISAGFCPVVLDLLKPISCEILDEMSIAVSDKILLMMNTKINYLASLFRHQLA